MVRFVCVVVVAFAVRLLNNLCHDFSLHREPPGYNLVLSFAAAHIFFWELFLIMLTRAVVDDSIRDT